MGTISILRKTPADPDTPGQLAGELAQAQETYKARRANVIERGAQRAQALLALIEEAEQERLAHLKVIEQAQQTPV